MSETTSVIEQYTAMELKHINLQNIYNYLYKAGEATRLKISAHTGLSLPTVASNISDLERRGLVTDVGEQKSTGGRRARAYRCNNMARLAIGVEILKEEVQIVAIDLYGKIVKEDSSLTQFSNTEDYFQRFGDRINSFIDALEFPVERILGVGIALQGLVSEDGETVVYSEILRCTGTKRERFQQYIKIPCILIHDTEAAARAEIWNDLDISNAIYFALNRNFGGTLILNGRVHGTAKWSNSVIEHMCLDPHGPLCYCGKHGCIEAFCSVNRLMENAKMGLPEFFDAAHNGEPRCVKIWKEYLKYLALAMENIRMVVSCDFIIGGYLVQYMNQDDFDELSALVREQNFMNDSNFIMRSSRFGDKSPKLGAGILYIDRFLAKL
jgi:predicted NBD/HSP70 family sugar kinase